MDDTSAAPFPLVEAGVRRRKTYKIAGPQTWALARELYLAGLPAPEVAAKLGVSEHNLRKKATREGWSRRQHAERVLDLRLPAIGGDWRAREVRTAADDAGAVAAGAAHAPGEGAGAGVLAGAGAGAEAEATAETDPLVASAVMLRRAAAAALRGEGPRAQALMTLSEQLKRAYDAFAGPAAATPAAAQIAGGFPLAAAFGWYDALKADCAAQGDPAPSPAQAANLAATAGGGAADATAEVSWKASPDVFG